MRDMAHSICLMKLYQITMRKKFRFFVSDYLNSSHLKNSGLHLNKNGTSSIAKNFIDAIRSNWLVKRMIHNEESTKAHRVETVEPEQPNLDDSDLDLEGLKDL